MESLFPTFSPLWIEGSKGKSKGITSKLIRHYSARLSSEMNRASHIKSVLSRGLKSLQSVIQLLSPSFVTDSFCSADLFIDNILMSYKRRAPISIGRHFSFKMHRDFQCTNYGTHQESESSIRTTVQLTTDLFHEANFRYPDVSNLLSVWQTDGRFSANPKCCPVCLKNHHQQVTSTQNEAGVSDDEVTHLMVDPASGIPRLYERCRLDFSPHPMTVYFHIVGGGLEDSNRVSFMGDMKWPETLRLNDVEYEIVSRGFFAYAHYWCELVRYLDGIRGVWLFDDRKDDGRSQLLGRDLSLISGAQPDTSWVVYSRKPTKDEQKIIDRGITKIIMKNPDPLGDIPFVCPRDLEGVEEQIGEDSAPVEEQIIIDSAAVEEQIIKDSADSLPPMQGTALMAKQAFTTTMKSEPALDSAKFMASQLSGMTNIKNAETHFVHNNNGTDCIATLVSQSDNARCAFGQNVECPRLPDPTPSTAVDVIKPSHHQSSAGGEDADGTEETHPDSAKPTKERLILRLRNKRPASVTIPTKSLSPSPARSKKVTKPKKRAKAQGNQQISEVIQEEVKNIKAKPKGREKNSQRLLSVSKSLS